MCTFTKWEEGIAVGYVIKRMINKILRHNRYRLQTRQVNLGFLFAGIGFASYQDLRHGSGRSLKKNTLILSVVLENRQLNSMSITLTLQALEHFQIEAEYRI